MDRRRDGRGPADSVDCSGEHAGNTIGFSGQPAVAEKLPNARDFSARPTARAGAAEEMRHRPPNAAAPVAPDRRTILQIGGGVGRGPHASLGQRKNHDSDDPDQDCWRDQRQPIDHTLIRRLFRMASSALIAGQTHLVAALMTPEHSQLHQ